ncbi:MAG: molybdenum cofactor biosynthesis protein MoaE [Gemmatimonadota bacterium]|nr:MAG: molybdenum cofactor biosynthesis protein MoaE [Gemmatimonadota bacterium]
MMAPLGTAGPRMSARITVDPIDPAALLPVGSTADGAVSLFIGRVRDQAGGLSVRRLAYEAYAEMAREELADILSEAAARWTVGHLEAVHRTGTLELGEISVAIVVAAPHREQAYAASRYIIEEIKRRLPIWKRQEYDDGRSEWVGAAGSEHETRTGAK